MATRIYFRSEGSAPVTPSDWEFPNQINPLTLPATLKKNTGSTMTSKTEATGTTSPTFRAMFRFVIGPLKGQTISGTVKAQMRGSESNAGANANHALSIKIIQPNGADRGILCGANPTPVASDLNSAPHEYVTTLTNSKFEDSAESASITLTSQTATAGDYLVIEIGFRSATTVSRNITLSYGNDNATDLPEDTSTTAANNPWIEFSANIDFSQDLTCAFISSGSVVSAPTVAYVVTTPFISGTTLFTPVLAYGMVGANIAASQLFPASLAYVMAAQFIASGSQLFAPTLTQGGANQGVTGAFISAGSQLFAPATAYEVDLPVISASQLFTPTLAYAMTGAFISSGSQQFAPILAYEVDLPGIGSGLLLFAPTLATTYAMTGAFIASGSQPFAPSLAYVVDLPFFTGSSLFAPALDTTYAMTGAFTGPTVVLFAPSLATTYAMTGAFISATGVLFSPTLATTYDMIGAFIGSGSVLFIPTVAGADSLALPIISLSQLFGPTITTESFVSAPSMSFTVLNAPSLAYEIGLPTMSGTQMNPPTVALAGADLSMPTISAGSVLYMPSLAPEVQTPFLTTTGALYPPIVTRELNLLVGPTGLSVQNTRTEAVIANTISNLTVAASSIDVSIGLTENSVDVISDNKSSASVTPTGTGA